MAFIPQVSHRRQLKASYMIYGNALNSGVDLAVALSTSTTGLFSSSENRDSEMIEWALNEAWEYPGLPHAIRSFSEKRTAFGNNLMRN